MAGRGRDAGRGARGRLLALGCAVAAGLLAPLALLGGFAPVTLPIGPPWSPASLALDPLSAWFLLILAVAGVPACLFAAQAPLSRAQAVGLPVFLGGLALTLLAADALTLLLGFEAMSLSSWAIIAAGGERRAARLYLGFALLSGLALLGAVALLAPAGLSFAGLRAAPPEGVRAGMVLALLILGAGSKAGLAPFHLWLPVAHPAAPTAASALMSAAMVKVALYVLMRGLLDLAGPAQPAWWGVPLLALGAATALIGGIRANLERDLKAILACSTLENVGLIAVGIGLVLIFRGTDLRPLAALALGFVLLHALVHAAFKTLLFLGAGAAAQLAGSRDPDRLGGLIHRMPVVAACMALGAASAAALPPLAGFSSEWLLLQRLCRRGAWPTCPCSCWAPPRWPWWASPRLWRRRRWCGCSASSSSGGRARRAPPGPARRRVYCGSPCWCRRRCWRCWRSWPRRRCRWRAERRGCCSARRPCCR
jgi:formate hydrogenlyase subunit 3/multisubunit Na+/H+ antiporter MnhD subunit